MAGVSAAGDGWFEGRIQSPFYTPGSGSKEGLNVKNVQRTVLMMVKMPFTIPVQNVKAINPDHIGVTTMGHNGSIVHALSKEPAKEVIPIRRRKDGKIGFKRKAFEWVQTEKPKDRLRLWSTSWAPVAADEEAVPMAGKRLIVVKQGSSMHKY